MTLTPILRTKLYTPPVRAELIPRPRLLERLNTGLSEHHKLTLISAPAGYGKTTLVSGWLYAKEQSERRNDEIPPDPIRPPIKAAWLSLDADDNDPTRFMTYLLAALQCVDTAFGQNVQNMLALSPLPPLPVILGELLNDLLTYNILTVLVLDDYHIITNPVVHEALTYCIEHQPPQLHLVLTTREDPPLPLARLRARAQLTELRAYDLRFTPEEAREFFHRSMQLDLDADAIDTLETRTEGWAVGLQLAGLAMQHLPNRQNFLADFSGSHRYVIDYLAEEVIRQQDEATRDFLIRTAILDRLCSPLCDALLQDEGGKQKDDNAPLPGTAAPSFRPQSAACMLEYLERNNLFLVPLDGERRWYRYHHLFADYLRAGLTESEQVTLYKRAAAWHKANGLLIEAIRYALASGDSDFAADFIAQALEKEATWSGGNLAQWLSWLAALPQRVFTSRPQLSLNASRILYLSGRFDQAETQLAQTEHTLKSQPTLPDVEREAILALVALYRGAIAAVRGDSQQAIAHITFAQTRLPQDNHLAQARAYFGLGLAYEIADQSGQAVDNYMQSNEAAQSAGVLFLAIHALCAAAQVQIKQGRLNLAAQTCQTALDLTDGVPLPPLGLTWSILGGIALERNDLASAEKLLSDGIALSRQGGLTDDVIFGLAFLARLRAYQGDPTEALRVMQEVTSLMQAYGIQRMTVLASAYLARLHLYFGRMQAAAQWAAEVRPLRATISNEVVDLTLARVLLATGELDTIPAILHPLLEKANTAGRVQTCIEAMLLLALFHQAQKDMPAALDWLEKSLGLAAPTGFVRIFLDEGAELLKLLPQARAADPAFVNLLLQKHTPEETPPPLLRTQMPEALTGQELRVLDLLVAGMSNQEIADELVISVGTAKWHVHNVLQKLEVSSRAQAIVRAHELGLA